MLNFLSPYKMWLELLAIGVLIVGIVVSVHKFLDYEQAIGYQKAVAEYTAKQLISEQSARALESQLRSQLQEAQDAATRRDQILQTLTTALNNSSNSLLHTTTNLRNGLSTASVDAVRKTADAALAVFAECAAGYGEMAAKADHHASDTQTLIDAWPKVPTP